MTHSTGKNGDSHRNTNRSGHGSTAVAVVFAKGTGSRVRLGDGQVVKIQIRITAEVSCRFTTLRYFLAIVGKWMLLSVSFEESVLPGQGSRTFLPHPDHMPDNKKHPRIDPGLSHPGVLNAGRNGREWEDAWKETLALPLPVWSK